MTTFNPFTLENKRILVTGATSGIGRQVAISCARMGAVFTGVGRDLFRLEELNSELGAKHRVVSADLTSASGLKAVLDAIDVPMNGVVHAAGISRLSPVRMISERHLREVQSINVDAPVLLTQKLLKESKVAASGSILFVSSIAAHIGVPGVAVYSGTKAALIAIVRCLSLEVAPRGIRANCLSPSLVETPLFDLAMATAGSDSMARQRDNHPLGFGKPEDVANAAIFFLSDASRWITGTTLVMDGGLTVS